jgi:hypothetical protein
LLRSFGSALAAFFDPVGFAGPHRVCDRDPPARFVLVPDLAFGEHHVV